VSLMRYFTRAWVDGDLTEEESDTVVRVYRRHLEVIASRLPPGVLELSQRWSLNDALFKIVQFDHVNQQLLLRLRCGELQYGYYDLSLHYTGATVIDHTPYRLSGLVATAGVEVLYDEIDVTGDDRFEQRMILWPSGEFAVSCERFAFSLVPVASRDAP